MQEDLGPCSIHGRQVLCLSILLLEKAMVRVAVEEMVAYSLTP